MPSRSTTHTIPRRVGVALLAGVLMLAALAACTSRGERPETAETPARSYEAAKARVPLEGSEQKPLFWRVDEFSDPDAAAAAEAVQYYLTVSDVLGDTHPINAEFFDLMSYFATEERVEEVRGRYAPPISPAPEPTGPRWMWVLDARKLQEDEIVTSVCIDTGYYGLHPDGVFRRIEDTFYHQGWAMRGYSLRQEEDAGQPRWKVHDLVALSRLLPEDDYEELSQACREWANHEWEGGESN